VRVLVCWCCTGASIVHRVNGRSIANAGARGGGDVTPALPVVADGRRRPADVHVLAMPSDRGERHRKICSQLLATALLHPPVVSDMWFVVPREHVVPPGIPHVLSRTQCGNDGSYRVASVRARR
jgi:hypothetical protein